MQHINQYSGSGLYLVHNIRRLSNFLCFCINARRKLSAFPHYNNSTPNASPCSMLHQDVFTFHHPLESLLHPARHLSQIAIHLAWRATQDKTDNSLLGNMDILKAAQDMNLAIGQHHARLTRILNRKLGFSIFACDTSNCSPFVSKDRY